MRNRLLPSGERIPDYPRFVRLGVGRFWALWFWLLWFWLIPTSWMDTKVFRAKEPLRYRIWQTVVSQYGWWN